MEPVEQLVAALPADVVVTDPDAMEKYRHDWSRDESAGKPLAVVRAEDAGQVQTAVRWAAEHGIGVAKARWLPFIRSSAELDAQRGIKLALDPDRILNPGVLDPGTLDR
jgi:glycolate oxidase